MTELQGDATLVFSGIADAEFTPLELAGAPSLVFATAGNATLGAGAVGTRGTPASVGSGTGRT